MESIISYVMMVWFCLIWTQGVVAGEQGDSEIKKGEYIFRASGGCSCHVQEDGAEKGTLGGGRLMPTPFGTFYATNITPHKDRGIGQWSADDFYRAMTEGVHANGSHLYPSFPYSSFAKMDRSDVLAMWEYLRTIAMSQRENTPHDLGFPFNQRWGLTFWKYLNLDRTPIAANPEMSEQWNRGQYLVKAVAHCGECHTPRSFTGGLSQSAALTGNPDGPEGEPIPDISQGVEGILTWDIKDIAYYLKTGMTPDGDFAGGTMAEVIEQGYQHLSEGDLEAIATYLKLGKF